jgi:hypothetical protein
MITTGVDTCLGYSYGNRRPVVCEATGCTLPSARSQASLLAKRVLVFGIRVSPVPKR